MLPPGTRVPLEIGATSEATLAADVAACGRAPFDLGRQLPIRTDALLLPDGGAVLVLTVGKVFLHDLWELGSLYRVGSIVGLAVALLGVSFLTQRFVLPKEER